MYFGVCILCHTSQYTTLLALLCTDPPQLYLNWGICVYTAFVDLYFVFASLTTLNIIAMHASTVPSWHCSALTPRRLSSMHTSAHHPQAPHCTTKCSHQQRIVYLIVCPLTWALTLFLLGVCLLLKAHHTYYTSHISHFSVNVVDQLCLFLHNTNTVCSETCVEKLHKERKSVGTILVIILSTVCMPTCYSVRRKEDGDKRENIW